jgi:hypothetical protein
MIQRQRENAAKYLYDLSKIVAKLKSRNHPRLVMIYKIYDGETHNSVFPGAVTRGLLTVFNDVGAN